MQGLWDSLTMMALIETNTSWRWRLDAAWDLGINLFVSTARLIRMDNKIEQHVCLKFCFRIGKSASESFALLQEAFGENSLKRSTFEWIKRFNDDRTSVEDDTREMSEETGVSFGICRSIFHDDLGLKRQS
ncbi:hypothetical protein LAZ67_7001250 [Cordylochernes scorpioides]|uniref:Mos1 transposase HTH domain-containing protein n=1 Tax=Cordylochernes scorpioides TaxID=51811 RepID=A0ABY6KP05_9ARAC|nr:hypothetical protein LAZ67_7001250 [Cordylochernes scorpioides]